LADGPLRKYCPYCLEEFQDLKERCPNCKVPLADPHDRSSWASPEKEGTAEEEQGEPRPENGETVFAGLREFAEPMALAMNRAGIPALTFDCDPLASGELEGADTVEIIVPAPLFNAANWFVLGFEAASFPHTEDEEPPMQGGGECC